MDVEDILEKLKAKEVFVREVNTRGIAYHTPYLDEGIPELKAGTSIILRLFAKQIRLHGCTRQDFT